MLPDLSVQTGAGERIGDLPLVAKVASESTAKILHPLMPALNRAGSRSDAGCGAHFNRQVNDSLLEEAFFSNHAPGCDYATYGEVQIRASVWVERSGNRNHAITKLALDIDRKLHNHMVVDGLGTTFAALSDPTRRAMIERLTHGPASVRRLTEPFALSQQMISKHIAYLVRARMVIKTKRGRESICTLRPEAIKTVSDWAISYRRFWEESFDKLDVVVKEMKKAEVRDDKKHGE